MDNVTKATFWTILYNQMVIMNYLITVDEDVLATNMLETAYNGTKAMLEDLRNI